jgi:hypothetical protein
VNAQTKVTQADKVVGVHRKLSAARRQFHTLKLKKSGKNSFAGYDYFELGDFLVPALQVFDDVGLGATVSFDSEIASLTIVDLDNPEDQIVITSPMGSAALKGCHEVQNIGAVETYQRRYLWVAALEIVEHDALDKTTGKAGANENPRTGEDQPANGPAARTKLDGPHTSKTALKGAVNGIMNAVRKAKDNDDINAILKKPANKETIEQAERDWPELITGDPKIEGDNGLKGYVRARREQLAGSLTFQLLTSTLQECGSLNELRAWTREHGDKIDLLDGEESRKFEETYDATERGLVALANVSAG